jgi:hypothetical protein
MNLTRTFRWERFEPNLGENLELPEEKRFFLLISSGLSKVAMAELSGRFEDLQKRLASEEMTEESLIDALEAVYNGTIKVGEPSTIDGKKVDTFRDYLAVVVGVTGLYSWLELFTALRDFNSYSGTRALFYARRSGGISSIPAQSAAKNESATVAP